VPEGEERDRQLEEEGEGLRGRRGTESSKGRGHA